MSLTVVLFHGVWGLGHMAAGPCTPGLFYLRSSGIPRIGDMLRGRSFPSTLHVMQATFNVAKRDTLYIPNASVYL